jgi:hypothetical protein
LKKLAELLRSKDWQEKVAERLADLCEQPIDPQYENPGDTALAVYLWLLDTYDRDLARRCAEKVLAAPRCWWAWRVAGNPAQPAGKNGAPIAPQGAPPEAPQEG